MAIDPTSMTDPEKIRNLIVDARRQGRQDLVLQCQLRLAELAGLPYEDALERAFWQAVTVAEELKTEENGKTTRLSRTRQKYSRSGARKVIEDLALKPTTTDGFRILADNGRADLTFEGIVLRNSGLFAADVIAASRRKLLAHGLGEQVITGWMNES